MVPIGVFYQLVPVSEATIGYVHTHTARLLFRSHGRVHACSLNYANLHALIRAFSAVDYGSFFALTEGS
ncbi:hypothetical protein Y032_0268g806 [Ancylostoma ceylanicum]|nr:hypothetical protein Y032_0268g806 [Ancylostoma ceylanicum]